jgi:hypothetical protein
MGVVGGKLRDKEVDDEYRNSSVIFDDVEFEMEYDWCEHRAEQQKNVVWPTRTPSVQQRPSGQRNGDSGRRRY